MKYKMLEHASMAEMKEKHPDWIWNRSDTHVILGVPGTLDAFKTPVEPGDVYKRQIQITVDFLTFLTQRIFLYFP